MRADDRRSDPPERDAGFYKELRRKQLLLFGLAVSPVVLLVLLFVALVALMRLDYQELQR